MFKKNIFKKKKKKKKKKRRRRRRRRGEKMWDQTTSGIWGASTTP